MREKHADRHAHTQHIQTDRQFGESIDCTCALRHMVCWCVRSDVSRRVSTTDVRLPPPANSSSSSAQFHEGDNVEVGILLLFSLVCVVVTVVSL